MKITINRPTSLDLKDLMRATVPTINKRVAFILDGITQKEVIQKILVRAREIRILIRNDAHATMRLIETAPAKEEAYRYIWAAQSNKLLAELGSMFGKVAKQFGFTMNDAECSFEPDEVKEWAPPAVPQVPVGDLNFKLKDEGEDEEEGKDKNDKEDGAPGVLRSEGDEPEDDTLPGIPEEEEEQEQVEI